MRRSLVFMLTLIFVFAIFAGPAAPKADAVVVSSVIVGTVIAAMAAAGIGLTVSGMTSTTLSDWVSGKLNSWATSLGGSVEDHINGNLITTTASGIISIGTSAANSIAQFLGWLQSDENLTDNMTSTVLGGGGAQEVPVKQNIVPDTEYLIQNGYIILQNRIGAAYDTYLLVSDSLSNNIAAAAWYVDGDYGIICVAKKTQSNSSSTAYFYSSANGSRAKSMDINDERLGISYGIYRSFTDYTFNCPGYNSLQDCLQGLSDYLDGNIESMSIETGVITIPTIDTNTQDKWFLDVGAAPGTTIETVTDAVIADTIEGDLTVSGEVAEEEPEFVIDEPIAVSGLSEVFPFCIPFDIYALLSALSADPQTPVFTARFVVPGIIDEEFTIDLTPFNAVAQIVRTMELLAFIIGLALVTRERFLRS